MPPPEPAWGLMLSEARSTLMAGKWWLTVFPGACILLVVLATQLLGDMGADVVKVENGTGDIMRHAGPSPAPGMGAIYMGCNRNKRAMLLDLHNGLTQQGDRLGGHLMSGHVDGTGTVAKFDAVGDNRRLVIEAPPAIARYIARKGSIAVNGVSLTVNAVDGNAFEVNLIAHTLSATTLQHLKPGMRVNLEVDMLARYIERLHEAGGAEQARN